ncbi:MAG: GDP-mannose 4,6-dehydratase [Promethearchaeota archaeon]
MDTYLVTGCAGFIASKVSELLLKRGDKIIGIDNLNDAYDVNLKKWRLEQLLKFENFIFHKIDITNLLQLEKIFTQDTFDAIINLAARAGVRFSVENPWIYIDTNIKGTLNLLELCKKYYIKKFILASTSSLYGETSLPFKENIKTDYPLSPYASSKKGAETLCYTYHYLYDIDISILRYFTVYGPAGRPDMSIFIFSKKINNGEVISVYGDGLQQRDFTYVDDIAQGTIAALKPLGYQIINLGSDYPVKLNYVIKLIEENLNKKARKKYLPKHPADVSATWADISKARELLSWKPKVKTEEGVKRAVHWLKENWAWARKIKV